MKRKILSHATLKFRNFLVLSLPTRKSTKNKLSKGRSFLASGENFYSSLFVPAHLFLLLRQDREQERWITNEKGELLSFSWESPLVESRTNLEILGQNIGVKICNVTSHSSLQTRLMEIYGRFCCVLHFKRVIHIINYFYGIFLLLQGNSKSQLNL